MKLLSKIFYIVFILGVNSICFAENNYLDEFLKKDINLKPLFNSQGRIIDSIIIEINNEPYTLIDLFNYVNLHGERLNSMDDFAKDPSSFKRYLHDFILEELLRRDANQSGISVSEEEINAYVQEIKRQNNVTDAGFIKILKDKELTLDDYKKQVKSDIIKSRIISQKVRSKINIIDSDIEQEAIIKGSYKPKEDEILVEQIFYKTEDGISKKRRSEIKDELKQILAIIKDGKSMQDAAPDLYSNLGFIKAEDLRKELANVIAKLPPNVTSEIVETENGFYLLRVIDKRENDKSLSEELREKYKRELMEVKFQENLKNYLNTELPKKYNLQILL